MFAVFFFYKCKKKKDEQPNKFNKLVPKSVHSHKPQRPTVKAHLYKQIEALAIRRLIDLENNLFLIMTIGNGTSYEPIPDAEFRDDNSTQPRTTSSSSTNKWLIVSISIVALLGAIYGSKSLWYNKFNDIGSHDTIMKAMSSKVQLTSDGKLKLFDELSKLLVLFCSPI